MDAAAIWGKPGAGMHCLNCGKVYTGPHKGIRYRRGAEGRYESKTVPLSNGETSAYSGGYCSGKCAREAALHTFDVLPERGDILEWHIENPEADADLPKNERRYVTFQRSQRKQQG